MNYLGKEAGASVPELGSLYTGPGHRTCNLMNIVGMRNASGKNAGVRASSLPLIQRPIDGVTRLFPAQETSSSSYNRVRHF